MTVYLAPLPVHNPMADPMEIILQQIDAKAQACQKDYPKNNPHNQPGIHTGLWLLCLLLKYRCLWRLLEGIWYDLLHGAEDIGCPYWFLVVGKLQGSGCLRIIGHCQLLLCF